MATGFGIDPTLDEDGFPLSGQTAEDTRRVWGSLYSDGILNGLTVTPSSSGMSYTVSPGAAVFPYAEGQVVPAPVYGGVINVAPAPINGSRTDIVWAKQNIPSEGNSNVVIGYGPTLPERAVELAKFTLNPGQTNTAAALRVSDRRYAVPLASGTGVIHQWIDTTTGVLDQKAVTLGNGTVTLATDRRIRMSITTCLVSQGAYRWDNTNYCEAYFRFCLDGVPQVKYTTPGLGGAWGTYSFEYYLNVPAGTHTFSYIRAREVGPGLVGTHHGIDSDGHYRIGSVFTVEDMGPVA